MKKTVPELLEEAARTYCERNKLYGDNYKNFGHIMNAIFPNGLTIDTIETWTRLGLFVQLVGKITRYAEQLPTGGHQDSAHDAAVYSAMLEEMTESQKGALPL